MITTYDNVNHLSLRNDWIDIEATRTEKDGAEKEYSVSLAKLAEMKKRLESGYTSFWS
ncbi:MAG: hypothetical protein II886_10620 [Prevotella sp.]|nr:hypothetical protein [Prevotella sp.]